MLPLVQMHDVVPSHPPFDPRTANLNPDYFNRQPNPRRPSNPSQDPLHSHRNFPIRGAAPVQALHRVATSFVRPHSTKPDDEHSLRRKTPNGTIANGYDGAIHNLASGPPPLKQMIVPTSKGFPDINQSALGLQPQGPTWSFPATGGLHGPNLALDGPNPSPSSIPGWSVALPSAGFDTGGPNCGPVGQGIRNDYQGLPALQPMRGPDYQHAPSSAPFGAMGSYLHLQPGAWHTGPSDYRAPIPLANGYTPQNAGLDSAFMPAQSAMHHGLFNGPVMGSTHSFHLPLPSHPLDDGFSRYGQVPSLMHASHRSLEALSLSNSHDSIADASSPARFKSRALAQAHKAYSELLIFLNHSKKIQGKTGDRSRHSRLSMFPKLPKQLTASFNPPKIHSSNAFADMTTAFAPYAARTQDLGSPMSLNGRLQINHMPAHLDLDDRLHTGQPLQMPDAYVGSDMGAYMYPLKIARSPFANPVSPLVGARQSLELLASLCERSGWKWVDGMLLGGCLYYGLERYEDALEWFRRIVVLDQSHVEAISNIAATLYCLNRQEEAEKHWTRAVKLRPSYFEAVEHLVGLLVSNGRSQEAVNTIDFVQRALRTNGSGFSGDKISDANNEAETASTGTASSASGTVWEQNPLDSYALDTDHDSPELRFSSVTAKNLKPPGYGSCGYAIPGNENGRMLLLIHTKGNMLYSLKDIDRASQAFEEAVLISAGRNLIGIQNLIRMIHTVLSPGHPQAIVNSRGILQSTSASSPLLLPPDKAKHTARLVFASNNGQLPGLSYIPDGSHKRTVVSTTSNSLLSLAKIFQDAMSNGGSTPSLVRPPTGVGDILALYYLSLSLQESPSTANNVGILLASVQQAQQQPTSEAALTTTIPGIVPGSGLALALAYYRYGLLLDPKHVHLHTNLGSLLKDLGQLEMAISMYEKAVACDGTFDIALTNLANAVKDRGRVSEAIGYYKRAVASNPDFAEAVCGLSTALNSVCDWRGRGGVILHQAKYDRWHVDEHGMLQDAAKQRVSSGLTKRVVDIVGRQLRESSSWGVGVLQEHAINQLAVQLKDAGAGVMDVSLDIATELRRWAGRPWEGSRVIRLVERATRMAMYCWYQDKYVKRNRVPKRYSRPKLPSNLPVPSAPTVLPFHTFTSPLPASDIRMISQRNALRISCSTLRAPWLPATVYEPPQPPQPQLKIGYVSSDFNNHPLAHLMQSVFGMHDVKRVQAFCYATTASDRSIHRQQIEREAPVFRDVSSWSSDRLVEQIVADGIHILVNLNGYTRGARNEIFAARPAPIQMSFMGFAGTLGAEWCDYLLADSTAIPPSTLRPHRGNLNLADVFRDEADAEREGWIYSENIVFCRDTFFCCDHRQSGDGSDESGMSWEAEAARRWRMRKELFPGLSDDTIILGNFNQLYKIDPSTFRTWLRILAAVPKAVLWLLRFPELGENNLRRTAKAWAGDEIASRIIFTDVAPKQQHISRARVCDLFLDTPECNAHTTAADVLWSSTPLLTLPRYEYKMCSRMAASILKGALPKGVEGELAAEDLIAIDETQYESFAIKLGNSLSYHRKEGDYCEGSGRLADLRRLLWQSKWTCALFDTRRWVRDLEDAYEEAWRRWVAGESGDIHL